MLVLGAGELPSNINRGSSKHMVLKIKVLDLTVFAVRPLSLLQWPICNLTGFGK